MSRKTVSMIGNLTRDMMSDVMETSLKKPIQTGEFRKNPVEPAWRCPAEYIYELVKTEQFVMEYLKPKQAVTGRVILQLHGGGYIGPMKNIYRRFAVKYSQISFGADVLTPDYRVAPEHPYPAALEDAVYAYRWLLEEKKYQPSQIVVAGDSAGGGLALALCLYAKDHGLPLPAGIITMSPWTDVSLSGASYEENYTIDPLFGNSKENMLYQCSYIGNANPKNPYLSPLFGDFEGFPPMLMQVGAYEVLLDDTRAAAKKARCHDFIMALPNGYDTVVGEGGGTLSGGEKQRISIARAILKNAPIIILDEATASIDPENEHLIQQAISELTRGKTIITIAHRLATIRNADQILVVEDGRIAESGTHDELVKQNGVYRRFTAIREQAELWRIAAE